MFYGGLQTDKTHRRYSKHYSHDGSMEFTIDKQTNTTTFVTYIGGTAYSAPVIWHSKQGSSISNNFYYLHRDYLGVFLQSLIKMGISKKNGTLMHGRTERKETAQWAVLAKGPAGGLAGKVRRRQWKSIDKVCHYRSRLHRP